MHGLTKPLSALALTVTLGAAAGCTGTIEPNQAMPNAAGSSSAAGSGNSGGGGGGAVTPAACGATAAVRAPMRRLTRFEYNNTVRDLFGDTTSPANAFPSEESGNGFGNDADAQNVVPALIEQYASAAEKVAAAVTAPDRIRKLGDCAAQVTDAASEAACVKTIADSFTPKAWRRPLVAGEADSLVALFSSTRVKADFVTSLAAVVEAILQSPEFIYRPELGVPLAGRTDVKQPSPDELATRLSYLLWASTPDDALRAAAAAGQLSTPGGIRQQAQRLLADPRSHEVVRFFFDNLLPISGLSALERDKDIYSTFNAKIGSLMRTETQTFLEQEIFNGPGTWPGVFTANYTYVNQELATYYGLTGVTGDTFQKVMLDPATTHRGGLLTQAGIVAGPIHSNHENPVVRGSFVVQKLMCQVIPKPTGAILAKVTPPDPNSAATARQRFSTHSSDPVCHACHVNMDPYGFALENFNVVGLWRDQENNVTIDASGESSVLGKFNGPLEMEKAMAASEQVQQCFASQWMNFGYGRTLTQADACAVESVQSQFKAANYNVQELLLALTQSPQFLTLPAVAQ